ncbi:ORF6N domain-containing protein [Monoglobus pectinilyticus]|uniref:ORF6N domain-containing protein n=1 Tax=Monoglobus pectinilyticus TaxID=1981510 RepID=UPI00399C37F7
MQNAITVNNHQLSLKEYQGKRVVTLRDIDTVHNRPQGTARKRFNDNKGHFIEGEDYYKLQMSESRTFGINSPRGGIVVTESGYLMLVKSFTDDLAWEVQRQLVNTYFKQQQSKAEEITPKYYNGEPVITIQDIARLTGLNANTIRYYVRRLERNKDYYLLEWEDLAKFKRNNPSIDKMISSLCVINRQGAEKLAQMIQGVPIQDCFKALPEPKKNKIFNLSSIKPLKYIVDDGIRFSSIINDCFKSWTQSLTWDDIKDVQGIMRERFSDLQKCMEVIDNITVSNDKQLLFFD